MLKHVLLTVAGDGQKKSKKFFKIFKWAAESLNSLCELTSAANLVNILLRLRKLRTKSRVTCILRTNFEAGGVSALNSAASILGQFFF